MRCLSFKQGIRTFATDTIHVPVSEQEIRNALVQGDQQVFGIFFRDQYARLCTFAHSFVKDRDEAEEAVQQVFIQLWEKRLHVDIQLSIQAYLFRSVRNACLNKLRHAQVRRAYADEQQALASESPAASGLAFQNELQEQIHRAIEKLPEQCRLIFRLSRFESLKYAEIAEQLGISVKTVENQMGKALRILRNELKDYLILAIVFLQLLD